MHASPRSIYLQEKARVNQKAIPSGDCLLKPLDSSGIGKSRSRTAFLIPRRIGTTLGPVSHLEQEILAQPVILEKLLLCERGRVESIARSFDGREYHTLFVAARGSSDNAGRYAKYLFGARNRRVVALATPSLFTWFNASTSFASIFQLQKDC